jgi:hypothetical protein
VVILGVLGGPVVILHKTADTYGKCAASGRSVEWVGDFPFLGASAQKVDLVWLGPAKGAKYFDDDLLYLGERAGTGIVYDATRGAPIRFNQSDAILQATQTFNDACP